MLRKVVRTGLAMLVFAALLAAIPAQGAPPESFDTGIATPRAVSHVLIELAVPDPAAAGLGGRRVEHIFGSWYKLYLEPGETVDGMMTAFGRNAAVLTVEPDYLVAVDAAPDDPLYSRQWNMPQVQLEEAWGVTTGADADTGEGVVIAVLDTGVAPTGNDGFCHALFAEYNAVTGTSGPGAAVDNYNHGTHVAGTAAGCAYNATGVAGIAYNGRVMAVKVLGDDGRGYNADVAEGIVWAADNGAGVINMSLGSTCSSTWPACSSSIVNDAIAHAATQDVVIVASAGNSGRSVLGFPGNHPEVIGVAATRFDRAKASYSNSGAAVDLAAPGGQTSQDQNNDGFPDGILQETFIRGQSPKVWDYLNFQGTSMAAPHVAGAAALLRACVPEAGRDAVRAALEGYALDLGAAGFDTTYGNGFLQIHDALAGLAYAFGRDPQANCALTGEPPPCFAVSLVVDGPGTVTVEPPPDCDPDGGDSIEPTAYSFGTRLTFSAAPDAGYLFAGWSGDLSGATTPQTLRATRALMVTATFAPPPPEPQVIVSLKADGMAGVLAYADEDAVLDDPTAGLSLLFDGSAYGLGAKDIDALAQLSDGTLLISTDSNVKNLPGLGAVTVDDSDVVRFDPATGLYAWYFDGSDVGLTTTAEDVDAVALLPDGRLLISTSGAVKVSGVSAADEDVLAFTGVLGSATTSGTWALYLDGSDLSGSLSDVDGLAVLSGVVYLSADANVSLGGVTMAPGDVFACEPLSLGAITTCAAITRFWQGAAAGFPVGGNVDGVEVREP